MRRRAAIFISGRGTNMTALLAAMKDRAYPAEAALVFSNNPDAPGLQTAADQGIATAHVDHRPFKGDRSAFEAEINKVLAAHSVDLICLAGFLRILTGPFVEGWKDRLVNIHPSLLPSFKGLHTHRRVLDAGVAFHGCTVHLVRAEMDAGPILGQAMLTVADEDEDTLGSRVLSLEHQLYPAALAAYLQGDITLAGETLAPTPLSIRG
ncbi:MAG: phosphoribosylglycinamide formyltransferase [Paracoccaceae bacterium]|jgi:phosphoribosylglycinamide formyltransferase 1|nr:phosphoribosylglycinamide formyltransferase [Paracoccaceae bacterium]MDG1369924.1 phosphoribosylglycinamide formyltransferase [Paracoccaceae bacterium]MDG1973262.1 phosphoribosylglycinamide formyltransferase [Paracoccaceae bacterium]